MLDQKHLNQIYDFIGEEARTLMIDEMLMVDISLVLEHHINPENWDHSMPIPGINLTQLMQDLKQLDQTYYDEVLYNKIFN